MVKVAVVGVGSPLGREACRALSHWTESEIVLAIDHDLVGKSIRQLAGPRVVDVTIEEKLGQALERVETNAVLDFSHPAAALQHAESAMKRGVIPIIGSHLTNEEIRDIKSLHRMHKVPALVVPTFSVGAILLIHFAQLASRWMPDLHVVETSPASENPSLLTKLAAEHIAKAREQAKGHREGERTIIATDIPIHSVKLRGSPPVTTVMLGSKGESLLLRHEALDVTSAFDGIRMAVTSTRKLEGVVVGLENLIL